ncbi:RNase H1/viroplasmin domain-containing protein [Clostridium tyrobutyricum]|uniref:RNase H1/viroplasmin domain-containing protein n=1 Tax=Clostridium tyrobutyricum TaxID=1519 RepID=UPI0020117353|nr:RNase H1/viroplasmin domain-containing protein [Clostridium tyrobutyricum]MBR9649141.1 RNase H1/viroplasmin domain-containing protein [Clostridium tyrobutyricum]
MKNRIIINGIDLTEEYEKKLEKKINKQNKKKKKKYYAIKEGKGVTDKIVTTWEECKELVYGYPAVFKGFYTLDDAMEYLYTVNKEDVKKQFKYNMGKRKKKE